jgi:hypothetical protein
MYGLIHLVDVAFFLKNMTKDTSPIFRNGAICGACIALAQVSIAWLGNDVARETMFVFTLIWHLGVVFMAFILLLYQMRKSDLRFGIRPHTGTLA